ncbi:MAG: hypothetical protein ABWZ66_02275 [Pyrinomonadaceae bacterium]
METQKLLAYFQAGQTAIIERIRQVVELESTSRDIPGNRLVIDWIEAEARKISEDFIIERIFANGYGEHFILRAFSSAEKPVLLLGHTDTVHPRG